MNQPEIAPDPLSPLMIARNMPDKLKQLRASTSLKEALKTDLLLLAEWVDAAKAKLIDAKAVQKEAIRAKSAADFDVGRAERALAEATAYLLEMLDAEKRDPNRVQSSQTVDLAAAGKAFDDLDKEVGS